MINENNKIEMIIFDLDGTLWDTLDSTLKCANKVLNNHNINKEISMETVKSSMGHSLEECAKRYMPFLDEETRITLLKEIIALNSKTLSELGGNLYPNLENVLNTLKKQYKLSIVSNCGANYIESFLDSSGLGKYFDDFLAASKFQISKAQAIKEVIERNNIKNAIYVGDTNKDFQSCIEANIPFIHAKYGFGGDLNSLYSIDKLSDLPQLLENIN